MIEEVKVMQWIGTCYPPEHLSILLYIEIYRQDNEDKSKAYYWDYRLMSGFYSYGDYEEEEGYYLDMINGHQKFIETPYIKIRKWTLLPKPPKHKKYIKV